MVEEVTQEENVTASDEVKTFTQSEVDNLIKARMERATKKYSDYQELKQSAVELSELKAAQMSELEKAQTEAQSSAARVLELETQLRDRTVGSALREAATKHGAVDANAAVKLAEIEVELSDEGTILTDVDSAMSEFLQAHPYLLGNTESSTPANIPDAPGASRAGAPATPTLLEVGAMDPRHLARNPEALKAAIEAMNTRR